MAELEKVIKGIESCKQGKCDYHCPYASMNVGCRYKLMDDALELLKEYKRHDECPCAHCMEFECDEVCEEYKKWKDS